jgi:hypothetical protein
MLNIRNRVACREGDYDVIWKLSLDSTQELHGVATDTTGRSLQDLLDVDCYLHPHLARIAVSSVRIMEEGA